MNGCDCVQIKLYLQRQLPHHILELLKSLKMGASEYLGSVDGVR